jgi:hypothetical protein
LEFLDVSLQISLMLVLLVRGARCADLCQHAFKLDDAFVDLFEGSLDLAWLEARN